MRLFSLNKTTTDGWPREAPFPHLVGSKDHGRPVAGLRSLCAKVQKPVQTIVELGVELGGSTRVFLDAFPSAKIFSIDPWIENYPIHQTWKDKIGTEYERSRGSLLPIFQSIFWDQKNRIKPIRKYSDAGMRLLYDQSIKPEVVFVDADHRYFGVAADLILIQTLFPYALILGDDWMFNPTAPKYRGIQYPVRRAAQDFAIHYERQYEAEENSYLIWV